MGIPPFSPTIPITSPFEIHEEPNLTRMILPNRPRSVFVIVGCSSLGMALVIWLLVVFVFGVPIQFDLGFVFFGVPILIFVLLGCLIFLIGYLGSRIEMEIHSDQLVMIDHFGFFRVTRRRPRQEIRRIVVQESIFSLNEQQKKLQLGRGMAARISIEGTLMAPLHFGLGYSLETLRQVAQELSRRCGWTESSTSQKAIPIIEIGPEELFGERDDLPPNSRAILEEAKEGITIRLPPRGVWRSASGLFIGALCFLGMLVFFLSFAGPAIIRGKVPTDICIVLAIAILAGIGVLIVAIAAGRSQAVLAVVGDQLFYFHKGLFWSRRQEWHRDQLHDIRIGMSSVSMNDRLSIEMKLYFLEGKPKGLLRGRDEEELRWAATKLRKSLRLPKTNKIAEEPLATK
jgi:hypothetical protein